MPDNEFFQEMHYVKQSDGTYSSYKWSKDKGYFVTMENNVEPPSGADTYESVGDWSTARDTERGAAGEFGAESVSKDDFIDTDGNMLPMDTIMNNVRKKFPGIEDEAVLRANILDMLPQFQPVDEEKLGFLEEDRTAALAEAGLSDEERELANTQAGDVYGLGMSAAGRQKEGIEETYGLGVSAAGRAKGAAEDVYGAAEEAFTLGKSAAKRSLETGLGGVQSQAAAAGKQMQAMAGGMGGGMRGAMGAQASMTKGLGQAYGAFGDEQTRLAGAKGRAASAFGRAGEAYGDEMTRLGGARGRGLGAVSDEELRLGQESGYATTAYDIEGKRIEADRAAADRKFRKGEYGLEDAATADYEADLATWIQPEWTKAKKGGYVFKDKSGIGENTRSRKTFLDILTELPDAGGS